MREGRDSAAQDREPNAPEPGEASAPQQPAPRGAEPTEQPAPPRDDMTAPEQPAARIPVEIWTLLVATFFMALGFGLVVPVLPQFASSFNVGATLVAIVVSAFAFVRLVSAPLGGSLVNRFGERIMYVIGMLIVSASSFATAFAGDYLQLLLFRGLGGIGSVMFTIASAGILAKYAPPSLRGRVSAMWGGMFLVGNISGPIAGGLLGQFGMRLPFLVYGAAMVISATIVGVAALRGRRVTRADTTPAQPPRRLREVLGDGAFRRLLVSGSANGWVNFGVRTATIPLFVAAAVSAEPWVAGAVIASTALGNVVTLQWSGRAADRIGRKPLVMWGSIIAGVSLLAMIPVQDIVSLLIVGFVGGVGAGLMNPANQAMVADIVGHGRSGGQVLSTFQMAQDLGTIIGPIVTGIIIDGLGYGWAFGLAGAIMLGVGMLWLRGPETLGRAN